MQNQVLMVEGLSGDSGVGSSVVSLRTNIKCDSNVPERGGVHLYSREYDSTTVLHTAHGVGVTIDMAVHDAAYAALTRLRGEYRELDTSPFRHIALG